MENPRVLSIGLEDPRVLHFAFDSNSIRSYITNVKVVTSNNILRLPRVANT